jgi:hypothetical protein
MITKVMIIPPSDTPDPQPSRNQCQSPRRANDADTGQRRRTLKATGPCLLTSAVIEGSQKRAFTLRAPLHKNTFGLLALGHNQGAAEAANYANVSVDNRAPDPPL